MQNIIIYFTLICWYNIIQGTVCIYSSLVKLKILICAHKHTETGHAHPKVCLSTIMQLSLKGRGHDMMSSSVLVYLISLPAKASLD